MKDASNRAGQEKKELSLHRNRNRIRVRLWFIKYSRHNRLISNAAAKLRRTGNYGRKNKTIILLFLDWSKRVLSTNLPCLSTRLAMTACWSSNLSATLVERTPTTGTWLWTKWRNCTGEVNEIFERYCFNKGDKLPTESVDTFVAELKTLAKTGNFSDCLRDSIIHDPIVLGFKNEQTAKKLLRMRDLTLNRCIEVCRTEEAAELQMNSLSETVNNINQMKSKTSKVDLPNRKDNFLQVLRLWTCSG